MIIHYVDVSIAVILQEEKASASVSTLENAPQAITIPPPKFRIEKVPCSLRKSLQQEWLGWKLFSKWLEL